MGHSIYRRYNMKLNKELPSYNTLIESIQGYLKECRHIEETSERPGEDYGASLKEEKGETVVSFYNYKSSAPVFLSHEVLELIKKNINSDPSIYYYYLEEECYGGWNLMSVYGKAEIVLEQFTSHTSVESSSKQLLKCFHDSLYSNFNDSVQLTDTASIIDCIKKLSQKAYSIDYLVTKRKRPAYDPCSAYRYRFLIPLFRKDDKSVILAGYDFFKSELVLYRMRKPKDSYEEGLYISYFDMEFAEFIENKKDIIANNLTNPKMVSIHNSIDYYRNNSFYAKNPDRYFHRHNGVVKLFDHNGPFIKVNNKILKAD